MSEQQKSDIKHQFTYHPPNEDQQKRYVALREKARELAHLIVDSSQECREQSLALTKLRESVMWVNAAIALEK